MATISNAAVAGNLAEVLIELGGISADRIHHDPAPGKATFYSWDRLPNRQLPQESVPQWVPDLAVEVLSPGNTFPEMSRKRREYFHAGVPLVWMIDPRERTVAVFSSLTECDIPFGSQQLTGGNVLPGLGIELTELFAELDRQPPPA